MMSDYFISQVYPSDKRTNAQVDALLEQEGIRRDANLDYTCVMFDNDYRAIATGSCFGNTLRCMAVDHHHQGEGLMNEIVSHLVQYQYERGNLHLFLYTKCSSAKFLVTWGSMRLPGSKIRSSSWRTGRTVFQLPGPAGPKPGGSAQSGSYCHECQSLYPGASVSG